MKQKIIKADVFTHPVIIGRASSNKLVLLDGANRLHALITLGIEYVLAQVVDYEKSGVKVDRWDHLILGKNRLFQKIAKLATTEGKDAVKIQHYSGEILHVSSSRLKQLVAIYLGKTEIIRIRPGQSLTDLKRLYPPFLAVIRFPIISHESVVEAATSGRTIPSGITRHVLNVRALSVNLPLQILKSNESVGDKNRWLKKFIQKKVLAKEIRYYQEPTVLYNE